MLWALISSAAFLLFNRPEIALLIFNMLILSLGLTLLVGALQTEILPQTDSTWSKQLWAAGLIGILLTSPHFVVWNTLSLMENSTWTTMLLLTTIAVLQTNPFTNKNLSFLAILLPLLILCRPESYLWSAVFVGILFLRAIHTLGIKNSVRLIGKPATSVVLAVVLLTSFRLTYFGYPLPNTFYAKVSPSFAYNLQTGVSYLAGFFFSSWVISVMILICLAAGVNSLLNLIKTKGNLPNWQYLPFLALLGLLIPVITGGDHFIEFRFFQAVYPLVALTVIYWIRIVLPTYIPRLNTIFDGTNNSSLAQAIIGILIVSVVFGQVSYWRYVSTEAGLDHDFALAAHGRVRGDMLNLAFENQSEMPSVGVLAAGGVKFTYTGEVIDLLGLNNTQMAHNGGDRKGRKNHAAFESTTFYELRPILVEPIIVNRSDWAFDPENSDTFLFNEDMLKEVYLEPEFLSLYSFAEISSPQFDDGMVIVGWVSSAYLSELNRSETLQITVYQ